MTKDKCTPTIWPCSGPLHRAWGMKRCWQHLFRRSTESLVRAVPCRLSQPCNDCVSWNILTSLHPSCIPGKGTGPTRWMWCRRARPVLLLLDRPTRRLSCMQRGVWPSQKRLRLASTLESVLETTAVVVCCKSDLCLVCGADCEVPAVTEGRSAARVFMMPSCWRRRSRWARGRRGSKP